MKNILKLSVLILSVALTCLGATTALVPVGGETGQDSRSFMIGWQFSVSSPVTVTALAYVDPKKTGLVELDRVAIFDQTGTILVSATVQPGAGVAAQDGFRLSTVNNYTLQPGTYGSQANGFQTLTIRSSEPPACRQFPKLPTSRSATRNQRLHSANTNECPERRRSIRSLLRGSGNSGSHTDHNRYRQLRHIYLVIHAGHVRDDLRKEPGVRSACLGSERLSRQHAANIAGWHFGACGWKTRIC